MTTQTARSAWFAVEETTHRPAPPPRLAARRPWGALALSLLGTVCLIVAAVLAVGLVLGGCASSPEARRLAHELREQIKVNRAASDPKPGVDPALWDAGQDEAARAAANLEKEVQ